MGFDEGVTGDARWRLAWSRRLLAAFFGLAISIDVSGLQRMAGQAQATAGQQQALGLVLLIAALCALLAVTFRRNAREGSGPGEIEAAVPSELQARIEGKARSIALATGSEDEEAARSRAYFRLKAQVRRWKQDATSDGDWQSVKDEGRAGPQSAGGKPPRPVEHDPWSRILEEEAKKHRGRGR